MGSVLVVGLGSLLNQPIGDPVQSNTANHVTHKALFEIKREQHDRCQSTIAPVDMNSKKWHPFINSLNTYLLVH